MELALNQPNLRDGFTRLFNFSLDTGGPGVIKQYGSDF